MSDLAIKLIDEANEKKSTFLDLGNCGLKAIPKEITKLSGFLEHLNLGSQYLENYAYKSSINKLSVNNFSGEDNDLNLLTELKHIKKLDFYSSHIGEKGAKYISRLSSLTSLNLEYNDIGEKEAEHISNLSALTSLNLDSNNIGSKGAKHISRLSALTSLNLRSNNIDEKGAEHISRLSSLTSLNLNSNKIGEKGAEHISKLSSLTSLNLYSNKIGEKGAEHISRLSSLIYLNLNSNNINEKGAEHISKLSFLTSLNLGENNISEKGAEHISKLLSLLTLSLYKNNIGDKGAEHISRLSALTSLDLNSNNISEKGAEQICKLSALTSLHISYNNIGDIGAKHISRLSALTSLNFWRSTIGEKGAGHISSLSALTSLDISLNKIGEKGAEHISRLSALTSLNLWSNDIGDNGAEHISRLSALTSLNLDDNNISEKGAEHISRLSALTSLNLWLNKIGEKGALHISRLSALTALSLRTNNIGDKGAEYISRLSALTSLNVINNMIGDAGIKRIVTSLPGLFRLEAENNKTESINPELLNDINALRALFRSTEMVDNNRVKMILIGNTKAGKTTLAQWLSEKKYIKEKESTHGIQHWIWNTSSANGLSVNIWDFGGQDYYHATHEIFFSDETLFLLLKSSETGKDSDEQQLSSGYWLEYVATRCNSDKTPLWYLQTKADIDPYGNKWLHQDDLRIFNVEAQYQVAIEKTFEKAEPFLGDFSHFEKKLIEKLNQLSLTKIPASWAMIRDKFLSAWRKKDLFLDEKKFRTKCETALKGEQHLLEDLQNTWEGLIPYLSRCGELVTFLNDAGLKDKIFLGAKELTDALYQLLSKDVEKISLGKFTDEHIKKVKHGEVLKDVLMVYGLIFKDPRDEKVFVAPQFLPIDPHVQHFSKLIPLSFALRFPNYMSRSVITRFISQYVKDDKESFYWRYDAFFKMRDIHCFVRIDAQKQIIYVHAEDKKEKYSVMKELYSFFCSYGILTGSETTSESPGHVSAGMNENTLLKEKKTTPGYLQVNEHKVALSLDGENFAIVTEIRQEITNRAYRVKCTNGHYLEINAVIHQLLNTLTSMPKRIFFSYSKKDENYRAELESHFAALRRSGKIDTWCDVNLTAGQEWDKKIKEELERADIVMLLLSSDFMATDYIWNTEIPKIIKEGKTVVPIFLRPCDWHEELYEVNKYTALPAKGDWIVQNSKPNRDEGYLKIIEGMKKLL